MSSHIIKDSLNINKKNQKEKKQKPIQYNISIIKKRFNKKKANLVAKVKNKKKENSKNKRQKNEDRHTFRNNNNNQLFFFDRIQNHFFKIIKREKSADHLKKNPSLRKKIQTFFNEIRYYDTNYIQHHIIKKTKQKNNKQTSNCRVFNTLTLFKKNKGELLIEKKRKSYFSPEKLD